MNNELSTDRSSVNYQLDTWMSDSPAIDTLSIAELVLPGAHNSGVDKKANYAFPLVFNWAACQTDSFYHQLIHGARALDLRLECEHGRDGSSIFWFQHSGWRSSRTLEGLLADTIRFLDKNPDEFIVLDFHELKHGNRMFDYVEFNRLLGHHLRRRTIPRENAHLPLGRLKEVSRQQRILVATPYHPDLDTEYLCRQIEHKWSGIDDTNTDELHAHITRVMKYPPSRSTPWSLSATCYNKATGPVRIGNYLDQWFDPVTDVWSRSSNIINADFFEDSNLVQHCRAANIMNANARIR